MKIYVPTKAIIDSLFIAQDKEDGKLYLAFYIKGRDSAPFICNDYWFDFREIDVNLENYRFYLFTTELFNRLLAYIKYEKDVKNGLKQFLIYLYRRANLANFHSISYKDLKNNNPKYQKAFWYAISNIFAPRFVGLDLEKFLKCFLFDLANNPNIQEYVYDIGEFQRPFLFKANPVLRYVGIADRLKHYISHFDSFLALFIVIYILIIVVL
jgi:hypothetical protein